MYNTPDPNWGELVKRLIVSLLLFGCVMSAQSKKGHRQPVARNVEGACHIRSQREDRGGSRRDLAKEIVDADAIVGASLTPELLKQAKQLKWLHISSAGVEAHGNQIGVFPAVINSDVVVTNARIVYGPQFAQRAHGFGMKVIGVDIRDVPTSVFVQRVVPPDMLNSVLPEADVLFVSVPSTDKSNGMMGARQFELMRQGSYFIAVSRGKVYDHMALAKALESKRLAGAGLDATDPEPLPKGHPLWKAPNVVITAHVSGGSDNLQARLDYIVKENIRRFGAGLPLLKVVDKKADF